MAIFQKWVENFIKNQSRYYPAIQNYLKSKPIKEVVTKLLDGDAFIFNEQFVVKEPNTPSSFNWHQDSGYINFEHKPYLTTWLALDDTHSLNGPLSVIPTNLETDCKSFNSPMVRQIKRLYLLRSMKLKQRLCMFLQELSWYFLALRLMPLEQINHPEQGQLI